MTRTMGAALEAHYQGAVTTIALMINLTLARFQPRITDITKANPGVVTTLWPHGYATGDTVKLVGVEGMTNVNGNFYQVTVVDSTHFSIGVDTTAYSTYLKGSSYGTARKTLGFTTHTSDLVFNGARYKSSNGADGSAISSSSDLSLSSRDVTVLIDSVDIKNEDLERGLYSGAEYETFEVNYQDLTQGRLLLEVGRVGDVAIRDQTFTAEGLSLANLLHQNTGPTISPVCRAQLGTRITDTYDQRFGCKVRLNPPTWLASTAYTAVQQYDAALGSVVKPSSYNGRHFKCTTAGTSGGSEPSWNTAIGATTSDGTAVWTAIDAKTKTGSITTVTDDRTFTDTGRTEIPGWFDHGLLTFTSGASAGWSSEVKRFYYESTDAFEEAEDNFASGTSIQVEFPDTAVVAGDVFFIHLLFDSQTITATTPAGWTLVDGPRNVGSTRRSYILSKVATGSETGFQTISLSGSVFARGRMFRFRGIAASSTDSDFVSGTGTVVSGPSLTAAVPSLAIAFVSDTATHAMAPFAGATGGTWTEPVAEISTMQVQSADMIGLGTISGGSFTLSTSAGWLVQAFLFSVPSATFILRDKAPFPLAASDTYEVEVGCDKIIETCKTKFDNVYNFRGEPWLPGFNKSLLYPDAAA